tara:strand:- start:1444 stop:2313 length:870 start_codon:yes stop_codon:yes gene_type:complete
MATTQKSSFANYSVTAADHILPDVVMAFKKKNVMAPLVWTAPAVAGAASVTFVDMTALASTDVDDLGETAEQGSDAIATGAHECIIKNYVVRADISDLARLGSAYDLVGGVSENLANAASLKLDDLLTDLFSGFSQTSGSASNALTLDQFFDAARQLHAAGAPMPFSYVGNSKQIWGAKGIQGLIVASSSGTLADNPVSAAMLGNGYVGQLGGVNIYFSEEVLEDGNNDCPAGMFSQKALGLGVSSAGLINVETQRDASYQATEYVCSLKCGVIEVMDTFGVYMLTDVA